MKIINTIKMKSILKIKESVKSRCILISMCISLMCVILIVVLSGKLYKESEYYPDQNVLERWGDKKTTHLSCYFSRECQIDKDFCDKLEKAYEDEGINVKMGYSSMSTVEAENNSLKTECNAISVNGDFFIFHPYELLSGSYFCEGDSNNYCVVDEYLAWDLYGSKKDIEGLTLKINGITYYIKGVYKHPKDSLYEKSGFEEKTIFIDESSKIYHDEEELVKDDNYIECLEVIVPEHVRLEGITKLNEKMSVLSDKITPEVSLFGNEYYTIVDNSNRYSIYNYFKFITKLEDRIIRDDFVRYPYWENVAIVSQYRAAKYFKLMIVAFIILLYSILILIRRLK